LKELHYAPTSEGTLVLSAHSGVGPQQKSVTSTHPNCTLV